MGAPSPRPATRSSLLALLLLACMLLATSAVAAGGATVLVSSASGSSDSVPAVGDSSLASAEDDEEEEDGSEETDELTPIPTAAIGSTTFALVDAVTCDAETVDTIETICSVNRAMFDTCVANSGYQIFPYSGTVPDADDITGLVSSASCMGFITAVVLLDMPACTVSQMPLRAVCETLLKLSVDMAQGEAAPDAAGFHEQMAWRRDSDLAKQAGEPYDNASAIYAAFETNLRVALTESNVTVLSNLTIIVDDYEGEEIDMDDGAEAAFDTSLDSDSAVGTVQAADTSDEEQEQTASTSDASDASTEGQTSVTALTSAATVASANSVIVAMATAVALAAFA